MDALQAQADALREDTAQLRARQEALEEQIAAILEEIGRTP